MKMCEFSLAPGCVCFAKELSLTTDIYTHAIGKQRPETCTHQSSEKREWKILRNMVIW